MNSADIIKAYVLRWLEEVFIQDWKSYEGWNQLAKQRGIEGSDRGVILSRSEQRQQIFWGKATNL